MKVYLVRHGQTEWNETHRFQGWVDIGLDAIGLIQAKLLTNFFKNITIDHIYTSDLSRSLKTAQMIQQLSACPLTLCHDFREMNIGVWEGLTWNEIQEQFKDDLEQYEDELFGVPISGGESLVEFQNRVVTLFMKIIKKNHENIVIFTHGGVIRVLICHLLGLDLNHRDVVKVENASISILNIDENQNIEIVEQNSIAHLSSS